LIALGLVIAALILPTHTPGARCSRVTQATISRTICVRGWTATIRPSSSYTSALKRARLAAWHYADQNPSDYEEDHLISLELGGAASVDAQSLAAAVVAGSPRRQRDRGPPAPAGLQPEADAPAGAGAGSHVQAQVRLSEAIRE